MSQATKLIVGVTLLLLAAAGLAVLAFGQSPLAVGPGKVQRMAAWDVASLSWRPWTLLGYGLTSNLYVGPGDAARMAYWNGTAWQEWNGTVPIAWLSAGNWKIFYSNGSGVVQQLSLPVAYYYLQGNGAAAAPTWVNVLRPARVTTTAGPDTLNSTRVWGNLMSGDSTVAMPLTSVMVNCVSSVNLGGLGDSMVNVNYGGIVAAHDCSMYPDAATASRKGSGIFGGWGCRNDGWIGSVTVGGNWNYIDSTIGTSVIAGGDQDSMISDGSTNDDAFMGAGVLNKFDHSHTSGLMGGAHAWVYYSPYFFGGGGDYDSTWSSRYTFNISGLKNKIKDGDTSGSLGGTHNYVEGALSVQINGYFDSLIANNTVAIGSRFAKLTGWHGATLGGDSLEVADSLGYAFGRAAHAIYPRSVMWNLHPAQVCSTQEADEFFVGGSIRTDSTRMNAMGGMDQLAYNNSGATMYRGWIVKSRTGANCGTEPVAAGDIHPIGTVYNVEVHNNSWYWMTYSGKGYVAVIDVPTSTVINGDRLLAVSAGTAGLADCYTTAGVPVHDREVGHPFSDGIVGQNTSPATDNICKAMIHFR